MILAALGLTLIAPGGQQAPSGQPGAGNGTDARAAMLRVGDAAGAVKIERETAETPAASSQQAYAAVPPIATWHVVIVIDISETGKILSCVDQTVGGPPAGLGDPCISFEGQTPPPIFEGLGGAGVPRQVTIEMAMASDTAPRPALRYHRASQKPNALTSAAFEVSKEGAVENCSKRETGEEGWTVKLPGLCTILPGPYMPSRDANGKPRRTAATLTMAVSTARQP